MAIEAIEFTAEEDDLIKTALDDGLEWGCDELSALRGKIKRFYLDSQARRCCYCRRLNATNHGRAWDVEHVIARVLQHSFMFEPENLAVACIDCNSAKSDRVVLVRPRTQFPRRSDAYSIVHPHYDEWDEHLMFGSYIYAPKSAKGSRTIDVCKLYRFYELEGQEALFAKDRRYADLAERMLFAKSAEEAEPSVFAINAMVEKAVAAELKAGEAVED